MNWLLEVLILSPALVALCIKRRAPNSFVRRSISAARIRWVAIAYSSVASAHFIVLRPSERVKVLDGLSLFTCDREALPQIRGTRSVPEYPAWLPFPFGRAIFACPLSSFPSGCFQRLQAKAQSAFA